MISSVPRTTSQHVYTSPYQYPDTNCKTITLRCLHCLINEFLSVKLCARMKQQIYSFPVCRFVQKIHVMRMCICSHSLQNIFICVLYMFLFHVLLSSTAFIVYTVYIYMYSFTNTDRTQTNIVYSSYTQDALHARAQK